MAAALVAVTMVPFTWVFMGPLNGEMFHLQAASMLSGQLMHSNTHHFVFRNANGLISVD